MSNHVYGSAYGYIKNPSKTRTMRATLRVGETEGVHEVPPGEVLLATYGPVNWPLWTLEWLPAPPKPRVGLCRFAR